MNILEYYETVQRSKQGIDGRTQSYITKPSVYENPDVAVQVACGLIACKYGRESGEFMELELEITNMFTIESVSLHFDEGRKMYILRAKKGERK